jgi:hypothetical protein
MLNLSLYFISQENGKKPKQVTHLEKPVKGVNVQVMEN